MNWFSAKLDLFKFGLQSVQVLSRLFQEVTIELSILRVSPKSSDFWCREKGQVKNTLDQTQLIYKFQVLVRKAQINEKQNYLLLYHCSKIAGLDTAFRGLVVVLPSDQRP